MGMDTDAGVYSAVARVVQILADMGRDVGKRVQNSAVWIVSSVITGALASAEIYYPTVLIPRPSLFSASDDGTGQGAIWHNGRGQLAPPADPANSGEVLAMYCVGLIEASVIPPQVLIGGRMAEVLFFGDAPGYQGYYQVNFRVPYGIAPGPAVPVRLNYLSRSSNAVSIALQ
jgi:uncharacterized protein (TIGR03437 family)